MRVLRHSLILLCLLSSAGISGCSLLGGLQTKPLYIPPATCVEIAQPGRMQVWITNTATGARELRTAEYPAGWYLVRPQVHGLGQPATPAAKGVTGRTTRASPHEDKPIEQTPTYLQ